MYDEVFQPKVLKMLCEEYGLRPSKSYGQHYLISDAPIKKMIQASELSVEDTVVEIGPGFGVLTLAIAPLVKRVIAFEIEQKLKPYWEEKQKQYPNIEMIWGNVLNEFDPKRVFPDTEHYKVLANIPYHITSDVLRVLLDARPLPDQIALLVQKEVAERMCAKPGDMSLLSVVVQHYGTPAIIAQAPSGMFWPPPKVDSAVVLIREIKKARNQESEKSFFSLARAGFSHKRKQLWHNVSAGLHLSPETVKGALRAIGQKETVRAEELSVGDWQQLNQILSS